MINMSTFSKILLIFLLQIVSLRSDGYRCLSVSMQDNTAVRNNKAGSYGGAIWIGTGARYRPRISALNVERMEAACGCECKGARTWLVPGGTLRSLQVAQLTCSKWLTPSD